jgi:hypothetical protein
MNVYFFKTEGYNMPYFIVYWLDFFTLKYFDVCVPQFVFLSQGLLEAG